MASVATAARTGQRMTRRGTLGGRVQVPTVLPSRSRTTQSRGTSSLTAGSTKWILVGPDLEGAFQTECRNAVLAAYKLPACGEPHREWCLGPVENGPGGYRTPFPTTAALEASVAEPPSSMMGADGTVEDTPIVPLRGHRGSP